ncbi:hypothetical protein A9255_11630 [Xenorhabdus hominickii]|uniref:Membrane protein n=1 Tax=Xenorhabdus hominickii TaxID=351679 RepID=A0A2G0Q8P7_XENHO|nr:hypothetical protein A9255_11630 [Xenorhabdus hominickii]PHM55585.1 membrane protein [Xenorhabdus hominickii]PHM57051.1 membrane protein [Xenorhabdus hominickii]
MSQQHNNDKLIYGEVKYAANHQFLASDRDRRHHDRFYLYVLAGLLLLAVAVMSWRDKANPRRLTTGLFWALYGFIFLVGKWSGDLVAIWVTDETHAQKIAHVSVGILVVVMALLAGFGGVRLGNYHQRTPEQRQESSERLGNHSI